MPDRELKIGDVVRLKSGGPDMTISAPGADSRIWSCCWFGDGEKLQVGFFPTAILVLGDEDEDE